VSARRAGLAAIAGARLAIAGAGLAGAGAAFTGAGLAGASSGADTGSVAGAIRAAAARLLEALDPEQRAAATYAFDDDERLDLRLVPIFLEGLRLREMDAAQRERVRALLAAGLSPEGLAKVEAIRSLENEVRRIDEQRLVTRWLAGSFRDPERYFLALFGDPEHPGAPFGFRFDGHHVSLNFTLTAAGEVATTPLFLGAQPARVPDGWERAGLRVLEAEEDGARALYLSLDAEQRRRATLPFEAERGLFVGGERRLELEGEPAGIARASLGAAQKAQLDRLVDLYLANFAPPLAAARRAEIEREGRDAIHFAWAGQTEPGRPVYYRIQGPGFLIEFDNTEPGAQHVHAVWRDFAGDFGLDALGRHRAEHHGLRLARGGAASRPSDPRRDASAPRTGREASRGSRNPLGPGAAPPCSMR
jgi:hypothetical protein